MMNNINSIMIHGGFTKTGQEEPVRELKLESGDVVALVGPTGSGKSMLLADIEQVAAADTPSGRSVAISGAEYGTKRGRMIAQLSQTMNFVINMNVGDFLELHAVSQGITEKAIIGEVITLANRLAGEPIAENMNITSLSGGQSRALMIADIAVISDSPVVLIDEIENAGIDKLTALELLSSQGKIIIIASHDPLIILQAERRVVMRDGGMSRVVTTREEERLLLHKLTAWDREISDIRNSLRTGNTIEIKPEVMLL